MNTAEPDVVEYWTKLRETLSQVNVHVINDWIREAQEKKASKKNSWLSYGLPIQRLRGKNQL
jgi:hypothetical protein